MPDEKPEKVTPATGAEKPEPLSPAMRAAVRLTVAGAAPIAVYRIAETYPLYAWGGATIAGYLVLSSDRVRKRLRWRAPRRPGWKTTRTLPERAAEAAMPRLEMRHDRIDLTHEWDSLCERAGWVKNGERVELLSVNRDPRSMRVAVRPLVATDEGKWDSIAQTVRRLIGAKTVRWWVDPTDSGVMVMQIGLVDLPLRVEVTPETAPAQVTPGRAMRFYLGPMGGGDDAYWEAGTRLHLGLMGETDGGKGNILGLILMQAAGVCDATVLNTKGSGEFSVYAGVPGYRIVSPAGHMDHDGDNRIVPLVDALADVEAHRQRVQRTLLDRGAKDWLSLPAPLRPRPHLVLVDEMTILFSACGRHSDRAASIAASLIMQARSAGIYFVGAAQRLDVRGLGYLGGILRSQLLSRLIVTGTDPAGLRMGAPGHDADILRALSGPKGRAAGIRLDSRPGADWVLVQVALLEPEVAAVVLRERGVLGGVSDIGMSDMTAPTPGGGEGPAGGVGRDMSDMTDMDESERETSAGDLGAQGGEVGETRSAPGEGVRAETGGWPSGTGGREGAGGDGGGARPEVVSLSDAVARFGRQERQIRRWLDGESPRPDDVPPIRWATPRRQNGRVMIEIGGGDRG